MVVKNEILGLENQYFKVPHDIIVITIHNNILYKTIPFLFGGIVSKQYFKLCEKKLDTTIILCRIWLVNSELPYLIICSIVQSHFML